LAHCRQAAVLTPESDLGASGCGDHFNLDRYRDGDLLVTLHITRVVEGSSLEITIWGSRDGEDWGTQPVARFPRKFYCGDYPMRLRLTDHPGMRFLRAGWRPERRGSVGPRGMVTAGIDVEPAPAESGEGSWG